jgi:hypothetical protein
MVLKFTKPLTEMSTWDLLGDKRRPKCKVDDLTVIESTKIKAKTKLNSVAWVCKQTIPTERQPLVGEVSANLWGFEDIGCCVVTK